MQEKFPKEKQLEREPHYEPTKTPKWYKSPSAPTFFIDNELMEGLVWERAEESDSSSALSFKISMMLKNSSKKSEFIAGQRRLKQFDEREVKRLVSVAFGGLGPVSISCCYK